jgi:GTP-binding protein
MPLPAAPPVVAIVGRPNVGKSTLFNRLVGRRAAIVHHTPGVTRDQHIVPAQWQGHPFLCVDTGGFEADDRETMGIHVQRQSRLAIAAADVVILVFDGRAGLSPADQDAVRILRRAGRPVVYAVNKVDTEKQAALVHEFARLGVEPLVPVSAEHARGMSALMSAVLDRLPAASITDVAPKEQRTRLALIGRPNVGKSSLLNRLAGVERAIVDANPGTTRDPIDTEVRLRGRPYVLVDTAGIRRRPRVVDAVERLTVMQSLRTIERAEIVLLVLDAAEGMTDQDARLAANAWQRGRGLAFLINKWDVVSARPVTEERWIEMLHERFPAFAAIPAACISAKTGWHLERIGPLIHGLEQALDVRLQTSRLNQVLRDAVAAQAPATVAGRVPRLLYASQIGVRPPAVAVFTTHPDGLKPSYVRYLQGRLAAAFHIRGCPVRLEFRSSRRASPPRTKPRRG